MGSSKEKGQRELTLTSTIAAGEKRKFWPSIYRWACYKTWEHPKFLILTQRIVITSTWMGIFTECCSALLISCWPIKSLSDVLHRMCALKVWSEETKDEKHQALPGTGMGAHLEGSSAWRRTLIICNIAKNLAYRFWRRSENAKNIKQQRGFYLRKSILWHTDRYIHIYITQRNIEVRINILHIHQKWRQREAIFWISNSNWASP